MNAILPLSHALVVTGMVNPWYKLEAGTREKLSLVAAFGLLTLLLLVWALFIRKTPGRRSRHDYRSAPASARSRSGESRGATAQPRKWRRRRRRDHRPRNPTLAETGGLPPIRTQGPPETAF